MHKTCWNTRSLIAHEVPRNKNNNPKYWRSGPAQIHVRGSSTYEHVTNSPCQQRIVCLFSLKTDTLETPTRTLGATLAHDTREALTPDTQETQKTSLRLVLDMRVSLTLDTWETHSIVPQATVTHKTRQTLLLETQETPTLSISDSYTWHTSKPFRSTHKQLSHSTHEQTLSLNTWTTITFDTQTTLMLDTQAN